MLMLSAQAAFLSDWVPIKYEGGGQMTTSTLSRLSAIVLMALVAVAGTAFAQDDPSGELSAGPRMIDEARTIPPGVDDAFVPLADGATRLSEVADVRDAASQHEPIQAAALWEQLAGLTEPQRDNAVIALELAGDAIVDTQTAAAEIATLWNSGAHEAAIAKLATLEKSGVPLGLGIAWETPVAPGTLRGLDVRLGATHSDAQTMTLDFDAQSGTLFSAVRWGSTTAIASWTMNMSVDGGTTWSETYSYASSVGVIDLDMVVVDDYAYVAYVAGNAADEARLRRCLTSTGELDGDFGFQVIFDAGAESVEEVALASNADDYNNRIYYAVTQSDDVLRWAWDAADDGATFTEASPSGASPDFGLDMTWDHHRSACDDYVFVSYAGSDGHVHVLGRGDSGVWTDWVVEASTGTFRRTAISAYEDSIICAFEYPYAYGAGIRYRISYDCGASWIPGSIAVPDGVTTFGYFEPDVDARDGNGTAIIYQAEAGEYDPMYYRTRAGFAPGAWSHPSMFNDYDIYTGSETALAHVPALSGETFSHGALYLSLDPDHRTLYFDRPSASGTSSDDSTPPTVYIDEPTLLSCACDSVEITGAVSDFDGTYVGDRLEYRRAGDAAWTVADTALGARAGVLYTWDTSALPQDSYSVRVVGTNECGLTSSDSTFVYRSTSFETAELRSPEHGEVYGGEICVDGSAWTQSCFEQYTVDYQPTGGAVWNPVDPYNTLYLSPVQNDPLAFWKTSSGPAAVVDGDYDLRLYAETTCGDVATVTNTITVDNTAPTAEITEPPACEFVSGLVDVVGTASDANLGSWTLEYTTDAGSDWTWIGSSTTPVVDGLLAVWDTTGLPACAYTLRLVVTDTARLDGTDNPHQTYHYVSVSVGCPEDIDGNGQVNLADLQLLLSRYGQLCD